MGDPEVCTPETLVRRLRLTTVKSLARVLDVENELSVDWRDFAQRLPKRPGSQQLRYDIKDIQYITHKQRTCGKSPTESILTDLGTLNTRVKDIVKILEEMNHLEAIQILLPDHVIAVPSSDLPGQGYRKQTPEFNANKICEFTQGEVAALTANFNTTSLLDGGRQIGEGGFGTVFLGYFRDGTKCAVKRLFKEGLHPDFNIVQQLKTEAATLMNLQHINLIKIYGYCLDNLSLVLEYISGGNLAQRLACEDNKPPLSWKSRVSIATAAAKGINFLHEMKYVHRDIKSANILLDGNLIPKIADFGLVRKLNDEVLLEIITGQRVFDKDRVGQDIITYMEEISEVEDAIMDVVDKKSSPFVDRQVKQMYSLANDCLQPKKQRPHMKQEGSQRDWIPCGTVGRGDRHFVSKGEKGRGGVSYHVDDLACHCCETRRVVKGTEYRVEQWEGEIDTLFQRVRRGGVVFLTTLMI
ncbi:putative interleukin-1 receptor-associated kinase 4 [Apostichopus japonicus]|uniref:non-specific serine/threonine protein kinase n=1 Tax=Stichopus japonicus TaxID=307972 RepID=A0A2G8KZU5_STIJA|nr:putative interleukin-1 receptor-associated kinase 4 [Apostichopus japonicus]